MNFTPSKYQQAVFTFIQEGEGHALINAVAGSGKSTTINKAFSYISGDQQCLLLAFNKSIVEDLKIKVKQENVMISTLHSLGCKAIMKKFRVKVDGMKYSRFVNQYFENGRNVPEHLTDEESWIFRGNIKKLIDLGRVNLCENEDELYVVADKFALDLMANEVHFALRFIKWGLQKEDVIDFTDMVYWPVVKKLWTPKYHWVFIDECQDLNAAQRELFLSCLRTDGRFVAVGDPHQAIYGFAGADSDSFKKLKGLGGVTEFPLSVCYRCDSDIIGLAKQLVPQIEARDNAASGIVDTDAKPENARSGDMVLCRFNAPLSSLCMSYIRQGIKAKIQGGDIGINLVKMVQATKLISIDDILEKLWSDFDKAVFRYANNHRITYGEAQESNTLINLRDKTETIGVLSEGLETAQELESRIKNIFSDISGTGIILSSIHKAKGLEADRVFILEADNMYAKGAMKLEWTREQEYNLQYVAYTRAKHYLGLIKSQQQ